MLKLKIQYFGHLMQAASLLEKTLMLGKTEGRRRRGWQRMRWLDGITDSMDMSEQTLGDSEGQGSLCAAVYGVAKSRPWLSNWTKTTPSLSLSLSVSQLNRIRWWADKTLLLHSPYEELYPTAEVPWEGSKFPLAHHLGNERQDQGFGFPNGQGSLGQWELRASFFSRRLCLWKLKKGNHQTKETVK